MGGVFSLPFCRVLPSFKRNEDIKTLIRVGIADDRTGHDCNAIVIGRQLQRIGRVLVEEVRICNPLGCGSIQSESTVGSIAHSSSGCKRSHLTGSVGSQQAGHIRSHLAAC